MESNRKMLKKLLQQSKVATETAENGHLAVSMVLNDIDNFHIIFMDNQMPVMVSSAV